MVSIEENKKRLAVFKEPYNPINGIGSPLSRFAFRMNESDVVYLPDSIKNENFIQAAIKHDNFELFSNGSMDFLFVFFKLRIKYDFEFWAASGIKIKDKKTSKDVYFVLNRAQRRFLLTLEKDRIAGVPIRVIVLKARQWGGSTLTQIYALWLQNVHHQSWNSCIVADIEDQTRNIRAMYSNAARHYLGLYGKITLKPFEGSTKNKIIVQTESVISIGSMQKPESLRSADLKIGHLSEIGSWKATKTKQPEDVIQTLIGTIPPLPDTMIVKESTAKGVGNYFQRFWKLSIDGETNYRTVFVSWFEFEDNQMLIDDYPKFISSLTDYEIFLWNSGATLEGIKWYRFKLKEYGGDTWRMQSEFPTNPQEAFQSTGRRVFPPIYVQNARSFNSTPLYIGDIFSDGQKGSLALRNISFAAAPEGAFWVWALPDKSQNIKYRYLVSVDIGGTTKEADWSVIRVFDRYWRMSGGVDEAVATYKCHLDQDILAWMAAKIAKFYNDALLVVEKNSLHKSKNSEGDAFETILNEIADDYDNIYERSTPQEQIIEGAPKKYGFSTNKSSKPMIVIQYKALLRDEGYFECDARVLDEADSFEVKEGVDVYGAVSGANDDMLMASMIGQWVSNNDMPMPKLIEQQAIKPSVKRKSIAKF